MVNVLSLFDGDGGAMVALEEAGIECSNYFASEINPHSIKVAKKNYPAIQHLGDVTKLSDEQLLALPKIDLLVGGSPCQGFSLQGTMYGSSTYTGIDVTSLEQYLELKEQGVVFKGESYLFWEYIRVLRLLKPKFFLLENVKVTGRWVAMFNEAVGVKPKLLDGAILSAQTRKRYYWTNIEVEPLVDKGLSISDIVGEPARGCAKRGRYNSEGITEQQLEFNKTNKANCITTVGKDSMVQVGDEVRNLSNEEREELQGLPRGYTSCAPKTHRLKMIGNGFNIPTVSHILKGIKNG